ncbi:hypothetical protein JTE90_004328 [Oedothorax gibbosus]|uniref:Uncharacterized protein n=1 Tax=Oedothorax gibbosus TaxID=931172 RepID=A0AAV6VKB6_9ARAC|nr:hypothetical protein JTE90_004328 [Oedothorax gibbosus]
MYSPQDAPSHPIHIKPLLSLHPPTPTPTLKGAQRPDQLIIPVVWLVWTQPKCVCMLKRNPAHFLPACFRDDHDQTGCSVVCMLLK